MVRLLAALRDPRRRPRLVIAMVLTLMLGIVFWAGSLTGTSTRVFCEKVCHIVHDDNTLAYNASTHSKIACVTCHEPVNANPVTFTVLKLFVMPDIYRTATHTFHLPMNAEDKIALTMPDEQCTQCHNLDNRKVSPRSGLKIDHAAHTSRGIRCTMCHNRVAHNDDAVKYTLPGDKRHQNWMTMDACFRCHSLKAGAKAPGTCSTCHPDDFALVPASHRKPGWYQAYGSSAGHAKAAIETSAEVTLSIKVEEATEIKDGKGTHPAGEFEPVRNSAGTVNTCYTCHKTTLCSDCHGGLQMPHPAGFTKGHGKLGYAKAAACAKCHGRSSAAATDLSFCNSCHHPGNTPGTTWLAQHPSAARKSGTEGCFKCHDELQCSYCHVRGPAAGLASIRAQFRGR